MGEAAEAAEPTELTRGKHVPLLDGVRGLAIVLVLVAHLVGIPMPATTRLGNLVSHAAAYGLLGVDLFFALSGFLITGILFDSRESKSYFKSFYLRRTLRIFPLHYASLIVLFFIAPLFVPHLREALAPTYDRQAWVWLYGVNVRNAIYGTTTLKYVDHYWSLGVEEHFYFVWPFVVKALPTRTLRTTAAVVSIVAAVAGVAAVAAGVKPVTVYVLTPFRLDLLCAGAFFAVVLRTKGLAPLARMARVLSAIGGAGYLATYALQIAAPSTIEIARHSRALALHLLIAALLAYAVSSTAGTITRRFFESRVLRWFGKYSYGLYVIHGILGVYMMDRGLEPWLYARLHSHLLAVAAYAAIGFGVSAALALVSYSVLEKPFLNLKRLAPSTPAPAPAEETIRDAA